MIIQKGAEDQAEIAKRRRLMHANKPVKNIKGKDDRSFLIKMPEEMPFKKIH